MREQRWIVVDATWDATVCIFADGTWCWDDELVDMEHMSDDFALVHVAEYEHGQTMEELADAYTRAYV
jgi:hypothetical protein